MSVAVEVSSDGKGPLYLVSLGGETGTLAGTNQKSGADGKELFKHIRDLLQRPPTQNWLVRDFLELDTTALLFGESTAGKTFAVVGIACSVATGQDWCGHKVKQGAVFYAAGEGQAGLAKRFLAWQQNSGVNLENTPIFLSTEAVCLPDDESLKQVIEWIDASGQAPRLIVFDTLARSLIGDENSSKDVGNFIRVIDTLRVRYGCCVLVVHHTGHFAAERARGSSALRAAVDTEISLTVKDGVRTLSVSKQKNHEPPAPKAFVLESVTLPWADEEGRPINSAVMIEAEGVEPSVKRAKQRLSGQEDAVLNALRLAIDDEGEPPSAAIRKRFGGFSEINGRNRRVAGLEQWRRLAYPILDTNGDKSTDAKKKAFQRIRRKLQGTGFVQTMDDFWWPIRDSDERDGTGQNGTFDALSRDGRDTPKGVCPVPSRVGTNSGGPDGPPRSSKVPSETKVDQEPDQSHPIAEFEELGPPDWLGYADDDENTETLSHEYFIDDDGNLVEIESSP